MRTLIFSIITLLFATACTDQERIAQYEKQLKESNEALEEVIDYRRHLMRARASENPEKAGYWKDLSEHYYSNGYQVISHFDQRVFIDSLINKFEFHEDLNNGQWDSLTVKLESLSPNDSSIARNLVLNELNRTLQKIANYSNTIFCGFRVPHIVPKILPTGDSSLVFLTSDFRIQIDDFVVNFDNPSVQNFKPINTLGYFFVPNDRKEESLNGTVHIINEDGLQTWQVKFSKDSIYEPSFIKTP